MQVSIGTNESARKLRLVGIILVGHTDDLARRLTLKDGILKVVNNGFLEFRRGPVGPL
jgi:hypothetical protein